MSQIRVAGNCAAASVLGVARMAAANDNLELAVGAKRLRKSAGDRNRSY
jgi:hypothetical protein